MEGWLPGAGGEEEDDGGALNGWEHSLSWGRVHSNLNVFDAMELYA